MITIFFWNWEESELRFRNQMYLDATTLDGAKTLGMKQWTEDGRQKLLILEIADYEKELLRVMYVEVRQNGKVVERQTRVGDTDQVLVEKHPE